MYVVTFYSFKGGVGRTMALTNVALALAQAGRRVLLVDFDLEAPGIETFEPLKAPSGAKGVVDFVGSYIASAQSPNVRDYVYKCARVEDSAGEVWVMPAGLRDETYSERLNAIDWQDLYSAKSGYILFEDLKAQWSEAFAPDYVLIDSRTGHTDIGGICTRQLPNAVVALFFPNEQNLIGMKKVVADVRREALPPRSKVIEIHFAASNVPDLDDEDGVLAAMLDRFRLEVQYKEVSIIRHYDSISLLNQTVFTVARPKSRLAKEYFDLRERIVSANPTDRDGALTFLRKEATRIAAGRPTADESALTARLELIENCLPTDGEVLFRVGVVYESVAHTEDAARLYSRAEQCGYELAELFGRRAALTQTEDSPSARRDLKADIQKLLRSHTATVRDLRFAVTMLRKYDRPRLRKLPDTVAFRSLPLDKQLRLVDLLLYERDTLPLRHLVGSLLKRRGEWPITAEMQPMVLALISLGRFVLAKEISAPVNPDFTQAAIPAAFNYAMAEWGETGLVPRRLLEKVVELEEHAPARSRHSGANYHQCLALALWASGRSEEAIQRLKEARQSLGPFKRRGLGELFSAWRFLNVGAGEFQRDIAEMERMFSGESLLPRFITRGRTASGSTRKKRETLPGRSI